MTSLTVILVAFFPAALHGVNASSDEARDIGTDKQLFVDDQMVASMEGVTFTLNPARRAERVLAPAEPWESAGVGFCTVVREGGRFQMWYGGWYYDETISGHWMQRVCYAESKDGIHWTKPHLGQYEFEGSKDNNIISVGYCGYAHGASVFIDPNAASPAEKYKMVFGDFYRVYPYEGCPRHTTISGAVSPDGIHWRSVETPHGVIMPGGTDTQNVAFYDPNIKKYVVYVRRNFYRTDVDGNRIRPASRRVGRSESQDFRSFPSSVEILAPDENDPGGQWGSGLYNTAATLYPFAPRTYLFFPTWMAYSNNVCTIQFASSRDGVHVERRHREPYVLPNPNAKRLGEQIGYTAYMGPGMSRVNDEIWMYGVEQDAPHDGNWYGRSVSGGIHRYVQRLDGFVSLDAMNQAGWASTKEFVLGGKTLEVNADASISPSASSLIVEVLDSRGQVLAVSAPINADGVALRPTWTSGKDLSEFIGSTVKLRFKMRYAKLYAYQVVDP